MKAECIVTGASKSTNVWYIGIHHFQVHEAICHVYSLVDSRKNLSKGEESVKISILALFDTLFHIKMGHKLCEASIDCF